MHLISFFKLMKFMRSHIHVMYTFDNTLLHSTYIVCLHAITDFDRVTAGNYVRNAINSIQHTHTPKQLKT